MWPRVNRTMYLLLLILSSMMSRVWGQPGKCDQTPPGAKVLTPTDTQQAPYKFTIVTKGFPGKYLPDQTYVLKLETLEMDRPFKEFMITAEDPDVDNNPFRFEHRSIDVGSLKTLDPKSRYSERCFSSVENTDNSDKYRIETHWVSPKSDITQKIRFRAMVAENDEVWYQGDELTITMERDNAKPIDSPPVSPNVTCSLCSEARYEVIFKGKWSRGTHPQNYPSKPDDNYYSHMVGASHDFDYVLWQQGSKASEGLKKLAQDADISKMERDIIEKMALKSGTRTLIRGKERHHPHMSEPSEALFRVDRFHHLFSIAVAMRPSPDWFLGVTRFELCTDEGWLKKHELGLYPWDAGIMDGISYESPKSVTQPEDNIERVAVGSFNKESPFYQMNLNDLKPFALLEVRLLDVYPLVGVDCNQEQEEEKKEEEATQNEEDAGDSRDEPSLAESRQQQCFSVWSDWSACTPDAGSCGTGFKVRMREFRTSDEVSGTLEPDRIACETEFAGERRQDYATCQIECKTT